MAQQNIRYAEVSVGPTAHSFRGIPQQTYMDGLARGRQRAQEDFGVDLNWRFELGRGPEQSPESWDYTTSVAIEGKDDGVVALGLAGPEYRLETSLFAPWFDRARTAGLHSAPHAGELAGPQSVWQALQALGAERIGHGVRSIEDPVLVDHLVHEQIPLEICPWSNIRLGLYQSLQGHPFPQLHGAGVQMSVNSDDPWLFDTTLTDEILSLVDPFGLDWRAVDEIGLNAVRHSFLPADRKKEMEASFRREMAALKVDGEPVQAPAGSSS
jgi:aminodeoxyfutalosine deaminase